MLKDETPNYVPEWIEKLTGNDWHELIADELGTRRVFGKCLDASPKWRLHGHGRRPDFKIKVDLLVDGTSGQVSLVMKGSQSPRESVFYRATQQLRSKVLPRVYRTWIEDDAPDGLHWILMTYHEPLAGSEASPEQILRSQAHIHAQCMDREDLLRQLHWRDSSLYPFTSESALLSSVTIIPRLLRQTSISLDKTALVRKLDRFTHGPSSSVKKLYQQPRTVTHCDLHPGNFLVTEPSGTGIIIDWAAALSNVPFFDVWRTVDYFATQCRCDPHILCRTYMQWASEQSCQFPKYRWEEFARLLIIARTVSQTIRLQRLLTHLLNEDTHDWDLRLPKWNNSHDLRQLISREAGNLRVGLDILETKCIDPWPS